MVENGFIYAFSENNPKYANMKRKQAKEKQKDNNKKLKCIFIDNGKINIVIINKSDLGVEIMKHDHLSSYKEVI